MYNAYLKECFLETVTKPQNYKILFNNFCEFEETLDKDIGEMSRQEIATCLSNMNYILFNAVENQISMIKKYLLWYADRNPGSVGLEVMLLSHKDVDLTNNFKTMLISDVDSIPNEFPDYKPSDGHFIVPVLMLSFYGITLKKICELRREDVIVSGCNVAIISDGSVILKIKSDVLANVLLDYMSWAGDDKYKPDNNGMLLTRRLRIDDFEEYPPLVGNQINARLYQIKERIAGGHAFAFSIGECRVSGQYYRLCEYYNMFNKWPDKNECKHIAGKQCRDEYDRACVINGAELYKEIFGL